MYNRGKILSIIKYLSIHIISPVNKSFKKTAPGGRSCFIFVFGRNSVTP